MRKGPILAVLDHEDIPVAAALARVAAARDAVVRRSRFWSLLRYRSTTPQSRMEMVRLSRTTSIVLDTAVTGWKSSMPMTHVTATIPTAEGTLRVHHRGWAKDLPRPIGTPDEPVECPPSLPRGCIAAVLAMLDHAETSLRSARPHADVIPALGELVHEHRTGCHSQAIAVMPTPWSAGRLIASCCDDLRLPDSVPMALGVSITDHDAFRVLEIRTDPVELSTPGNDPVARLRSIAALERLRTEFEA